MYYVSKYNSKVGRLTLKSDGKYLVGIIFPNGKNPDCCKKKDDLDIFVKTRKYLDEYFSGKVPTIELDMKLEGTEFRQKVWEILKQIPYGETMTYGEIARILAKEKGIKKMSSQAVGNAVGHNPIPIVVPCHRVIGRNKRLVGFSGGLDIKKKLLDIENIEYK